MIKYAVAPGVVRSKQDGDVHYISARQLIKLYGVDQAECIIMDSEAFFSDNHSEKMRSFSQEFLNSLVWLTPRYEGNYERP